MSETLHTQVARIFIPGDGIPQDTPPQNDVLREEPKATGSCSPIRAERRRTPRNHSPIPLFVYGHKPDGQPFYEESFTTAVNVHGGSMHLETSVQLGQRLLVTNRQNECTQPCIVVFVGARLAGGVDVAFSFTAAMPYFWNDPRLAKPISREAGRGLKLTAFVKQ
jgi:hypothetical protein